MPAREAGMLGAEPGLPLAAGAGGGLSADAELYRRQLSRIADSWRGLPDKPHEDPASTVRALWLAAAAPELSDGASMSLPALTDEGAATLDALVTRRLAGTPLGHLTRRQRFMDLEFETGPEAMIPRVETELLAGVALGELRAVVASRGAATVMDLCTGSGNIALTLAHAVPEARVAAADLLESAVGLASANARRLGVADRVALRAGDLFAPWESDEWWGRIDLLTCNPPYISSAKVPTMAPEIAEHEPRAAFDGGRFGMDVLVRLYTEAPRFLVPGGALCFEVGAGQGEFIAKRMEGTGAWAEVRRVRDSEGEVRVIAARRPA